MRDDDVKFQEVGQYKLVARLNKGVYRGALWRDGRIESQVQGTSLQDAYDKLQALVYEHQVDVVKSRGGAVPSVRESQAALQRCFPKMSGAQRAMLRAHFRAPEQRITATQLANAAGYESHSVANLYYGLLGAMLFAEMPIPLPKHANGTPIMTCNIACEEDDRIPGDSEWVWKMRPHIDQALRQIPAFSNG